MSLRMSRHSGFATTAFASVAHTYSHLFTLLYATVVLSLERDWGMGYAELIALSIPLSVMFGLGALPAGWLGDRWSASGMIAVFFIGTGAASMLTGFATGPAGMLAGLTLIGLFASIYHPVGIPWLVKRAVNRGRALGINGVFGSIGTAGAALVAGLLIDVSGWRAAFLVPGAVCVATGILFLLAMRGGLIVEGAEDAAPTPKPEAGDVKRAFFVLSVTMLCTGLIYQVTSVAMPKIFEERLAGTLGDGIAGIGVLVTVVYAASAVANMIGGELADRYDLKRVYVVLQLVQIPVIVIGFMLVSPALVGVAALMVGINTAAAPAENALLARYTPAKWRGRAFGAKFVLSLGIGAFGVALVPVLHKLFGHLDALFPVLAVLALGAGLAGLSLPGRRARQAAMPLTAPAE